MKAEETFSRKKVKEGPVGVRKPTVRKKHANRETQGKRTLHHLRASTPQRSPSPCMLSEASQ